MVHCDYNGGATYHLPIWFDDAELLVSYGQGMKHVALP